MYINGYDGDTRWQLKLINFDKRLAYAVVTCETKQ